MTRLRVRLFLLLKLALVHDLLNCVFGLAMLCHQILLKAVLAIASSSCQSESPCSTVLIIFLTYLTVYHGKPLNLSLAENWKVELSLFFELICVCSGHYMLLQNHDVIAICHRSAYACACGLLQRAAWYMTSTGLVHALAHVPMYAVVAVAVAVLQSTSTCSTFHYFNYLAGQSGSGEVMLMTSLSEALDRLLAVSTGYSS